MSMFKIVLFSFTISDVVFSKAEDKFKVDANEVIHMKLGILILTPFIFCNFIL